jgi:putative phage-type endonuclease
MISLKPSKYTIVDIEQGTPEWHKFRSTHLGASDTPVIMEMSPYRTPLQLWQQLVGEGSAQKETENMRAGTMLEAEIRTYVEDELDMTFKPVVLESAVLLWMSASLDGFSEDQNITLECKLNNKENHELARKNEICQAHYIQVQKQLLISDADYCVYASKNGDEILITKVMPDLIAINEIIDAETEFWKRVINYEQPELTDKDFIARNDKEWTDLERMYLDTVQRLEPLKELEKKKENLEDFFEKLCDGRSCVGNAVKVNIFKVKGCVDYKQIVKDFCINVEKYRTSPKSRTRISVI